MDFLSMTAQQVEALPEAKAQEVLAAWVKAQKTDLPLALTNSTSKVHAKLAKKALYQLQSSGVKATVEKPQEALQKPEAARNEFPAVLSMQLGTGERAFMFAVPLPGGGLEIYQGITHDEFGLAQFGSERTNRARYRTRLRQIEKDEESRMLLVPIERMLLELGRAITLNARTKTEYNADIARALDALGVTPQDPDIVIPALEATDAASAEDGASLHQLFEVEQWLPSEKDLINLTYRVDAIKMLPMPEAQRVSKMDELAKGLAKEIFTPEVRTIYARRLWYTAELVETLERKEDALKLRAEARRLVHQTTPSRFAEQMFVKVLATLPKSSAVAGAMPSLK